MISVTGMSHQGRHLKADDFLEVIALINKEKGFTLIELSIVSALMGVFLTLSWPAAKSIYRNFLLETSAQEIINCFTFARANSILNRCRYKLVLVESYHLDRKSKSVSYQLYREEMKEGKMIFISAQGRWGRSRSIPEEIEFETMSKEIFFFPNGTSSESEFTLKNGSAKPIRLEVFSHLGSARINEK